MRWFDKIFKPLHQKIQEVNRPSSSEQKYKQGTVDEELDRAIALSLSEEELYGKTHHTDNDEALARALQASLDLEDRPNPSPTINGRRWVGVYYCTGCKKEIEPGRFLSCMGGMWHPQCFCCAACSLPISGTEFAVSNNDPYHRECYKELFHPRCEVCRQFIPPNFAGLIEYRAHPFWGQRYCPSHEDDHTARCCSCERMEAKDAKYVSLDDGRKLCLECLDSAVMDSQECQPLHHEILDFYEGMNMRITQNIPMLLVERQALNEARANEKEHHHMPETRGLCLSEEQTVTSVFRKPKPGRGIPSFGEMRTESMKLSRHCEVTAILVLYGLPRLLTGSILVHELMHAWLRLSGFPSLLNPAVEEGICQVLAHMWLESQLGSSSSPSSSSSSSAAKPKQAFNTDKLREFFMHQIAMDTSAAYGDGFRSGQLAVVQFGLKRTLDHIRLTGQFPT